MLLRLLTYNIHHGKGMDRRIRLERAAALLGRMPLDVVAIQELDRGTARTDGADQLAALSAATGMHGVFAAAMEHDGGEYGNGLLSRLAVLGQDAGRHAMAVEVPEPRGFVEARLGLPGGGALRAVGTHLCYWSRENRAAALEALHERTVAEGLPTLLLGDLNCRLEEMGTPIGGLLEKGWSIGTGSGYPTFPSVHPHIGIDHIMAWPATMWRWGPVRVLEEPLISDHRPVYAELEFLGVGSGRVAKA